MTKSQRWLVIEDGRPGHYNQSLGMLQMLSSNSSITRFSLPAPRKHLKRPLQLLTWLCQRWPVMLHCFFTTYYRQSPPDRLLVDKLVSTGGDTLLANIILAHLWNIPNIFIGRRSKLTDRMIRLLVTTVGTSVPGRVVAIPFAPVLPAPASETIIAPGGPCIAVLIGGDSNEYQYALDDYITLADRLNQLCKTQGLRLLITTSRRTNADGEAALRERLHSDYIADATWYSISPRPTAAAYSRIAIAIFCSEDSGSMLTESLRYGVPVVAFHPNSTIKSTFYEHFLRKLSDHHVRRSSITALASLHINTLTATRPVDYSPLIQALDSLADNPTL